MQFSHIVEASCDFTDALTAFEENTKTIKADGGTNICNCLNEAISMLTKLKREYSDCKLRILCLSDGQDGGMEYFNTYKKLIQNDITLDSVIIGDVSRELKAISFASGGYVFCPKTINDGCRLYENESFMSWRLREESKTLRTHSKDS